MRVLLAQPFRILLFLVVLFPSLCAEASTVVVVPIEPVDLRPDGVPIEFDLDGDLVIDFAFSSTTILKDIVPEGANRALIDDQFGIQFVSNLEDGSFIGLPASNEMIWRSSQSALGGCASGGGGVVCRGNFIEDGLGFVGVEFDISGETHYGWIEIESLAFFGPRRIHRWAYETEPGVGIRAGQIPEPSSGLLWVFGAIAFTFRRGRDA